MLMVIDAVRSAGAGAALYSRVLGGAGVVRLWWRCLGMLRALHTAVGRGCAWVVAGCGRMDLADPSGRLATRRPIGAGKFGSIFSETKGPQANRFRRRKTLTPVSGPPRILRDSFSRNLAWVLLLISLCTPDAKGACLDWSRSVGRPDHSAVYTGMLGEHPVRIMLHLDVATGHFDGAYGYNDQPVVLILTGDMLPEGVGAELDERDPQGHLTGHFTLRFFRPRPAGEDLAAYDKEDRNTCEYLTGSWRSLSGNKKRKVALFPDGEIDPVYDEEREMNEVTAYKLRRAMLDSNRKSFASLLRYPFTKNSGRWVVGVWNNPEEVVKNYNKIIPFSKKQIKDAVPHILQTSQDTSQFMNGSVFITHGKVTLICGGRCPVLP